MKNQFNIFTGIIFLIVSSCTNGQTQNSKFSLSAKDFESKLKESSSSIVLDVRTPEEFSKGHLRNALNVDWNGSDFMAQVSKMDKARPVFVYCLAGARSASAAGEMRKVGFNAVYEMGGGIIKWRASGLAETTENVTKPAGLTLAQFNELVTSDKLVLVDFYADWCGPCKKMKPYLEEISKDLANKVVVVKINADDNQQLCKQLNIDELPVLQLYKNKNRIWINKGFIGKDEVLKQLN